MHSWYGSEQSFRETQSKLEAAQARMAYSDHDEPNPCTITKAQGVAVISIRGGLISETSFMSRWMGVASYQDIQEAVAFAANDGETKLILLNIDSPGGSAKGCKATAEMIRRVNDHVKPVVTFTNGMACSAGYWLFCAGQQRVIGEDAQVGSVGAIIVHTEHSAQLQQEGVTVTVKRSAPYKALATSVERLTPEASKELDDELEYLHEKFVDGISKLTGLRRSHVTEQVANGKVYRAEAAMELKLATFQLSFEETLTKLVKRVNRKPAASTTK